MYLIRGQHNLELFKEKFPGVVLHGTIGNFDGLHKGHQSILRKIKTDAEKTNSKTIVFFTEPHASEYFANKQDFKFLPPPRICSWREKFELLRDFGIDFAFFLKFNNSLQTMTPEKFITDILDNVGLCSFTVGDDFRFGINREGDFELLQSWGNQNDIFVSNTDTLKIHNERVSSTRIRQALLDSNFSLANELLGRPYSFSGKVVHGQQLGRTINVPTANIWMPSQKLPISGVYAVECLLEDKFLKGIANMGIRPTVGGKKPILEVHLFDFNEDIYSKRIQVEFKYKIREEKKFKNLDMLKLQIQKDIITAKEILKN